MRTLHSYSIKALFIISILTISFVNYSYGQNITLSSANSGTTYSDADYTCGTSIIDVSVTNDDDMWICICPPAGEFAQLDFTSIELEGGGGSNPDDYLYVYEGCGTGGTLLYNPTPSSGGISQVITASAPDVCLTIRVEERGTGNGTTGTLSAIINCVPNCMDDSPPTSNTLGFINNVTIGAYSNPTGGTFYTDYTGTGCVSMTQGQSYTFGMDITVSNAPDLEGYFWVDWNGDGIFEDEHIMGSSSVSTGFSEVFTVPCNAAVGSDVTIRFTVASTSTTVTSCGTSGTYDIYGETEDYCITIVAETSPVATAASVYVPCATSASLTGTTANGFWSLINGSGTIASNVDPTTTIDGLLNGSTTLQWTALSTSGCSTDTDTTIFVVSGLPDAVLTAGVDQYGCFNSTTLAGSDPAPFINGVWTVVSGPNTPSFTNNIDPNSDVTGLINGTYIFRWSVTTVSCGVQFDEVTIVVGSVPPADAGANQVLCPESAIMSAFLPAGFVGAWTQIPVLTTTITNSNDPNTLVYGLTAPGTYTYQWEISGGGCPGTTTALVDVVISACQNLAPIGGTYTGCNNLFTDDGGTAGNYSDGYPQSPTIFCPDDPNDFASMEFTAFDLAPGDYMLIHDSPSSGAPIVAYGTSAGIFTDPSGNNPSTEPLPFSLVSSTGCLYVTFFSNTSGNDPGWEANVTCTSTAGVANTNFISGDNCGGGGGITVCASGNYPTVNSNAGSPQEIGNGFGPGSTCIADGEGNSQWVYFNIETSGYLEFGIAPAGGQDFDFVIWGPYDGGISCPGFSGDDPIRCSWALNAESGCPWGSESEIGLAYNSPVATPSAVLPTDVNENIGTCVDGPGAEDGWLYPIDALAGEVYVMLIQNFAQNAANWTFTFDDTDPAAAGLGCNLPIPLPISLLSFDGESAGRKNNLYWTTASERNNDYFTVERSRDGFNWEILSIVDGAGTSLEFLMYNEIDNAPFKGVTYYRLKQTDFNGAFVYTKIIAISSELEDDRFTDIFPNPSNDQFFFNYGGKDYKTSILVEVYNSLGQLVISQDYSKFNKNVALSFDSKALAEGLYQVKISQGVNYEVQKVSIVR